MSRLPRIRFSPRSRRDTEPHLVAAGELVPGDLLALSARDVASERWCVVMRALPEGAGTVRVTVRPPLGGVERDEVFDRDWSVVVGGLRVDVDHHHLGRSVPLATDLDFDFGFDFGFVRRRERF
ncbi:hypothetical protein [Streptomyces poonensis]|nr:hypothetical protein [Streptomyces poonensis]